MVRTAKRLVTLLCLAGATFAGTTALFMAIAAIGSVVNGERLP